MAEQRPLANQVYAVTSRKARRWHTDVLCSGLDSWYRAEGYHALPPLVPEATARRHGLTPCWFCGTTVT